MKNYLLALMLVPFALNADVIYTNNGAKILGKITGIDAGAITVDTDFAGTLTIQQSEVSSFTTDEAINLRLKDGTSISGVVTSDSENIEVKAANSSVSSPVANLSTAWGLGAKDPALVALESKWSFEAGFNLTGKTGNSEEFNAGASFAATRLTQDDKLHFYAQYYHPDTDKVTYPSGESKEDSEDAGKAGMKYTDYFSKHMGWFVSEDVEFDDSEDLDFRSTTAVGVDYIHIKEDRLYVESSYGISYRYEDYAYLTRDAFTGDASYTNDSDGKLGLAFGLVVNWQFADWGKLTSNWKYLPAFEDLNDYIITQETAVNIPLGYSDFWQLKLGVASEYTNLVEADNDRLDSVYFARLLLSWD